MKLQFWSIGKANEPYVETGVEDFTRRISNYFKAEWNIIPVPKNTAMFSEAEQKKKEGEVIMQWLEKDDYLVVLDERGKQLTSEGLADFIQARANESSRKVVFLIGGAFGVDEWFSSAQISNGAFRHLYFHTNLSDLFSRNKCTGHAPF